MLEKEIRRRLCVNLEATGWLVELTHGSRYQTGFPDLFCAHPDHGQRWIDTKRPGKYTFTRAQRIKWPRWEGHGVGIWIATSEDPGVVDGPPNWRDYWRPSFAVPDTQSLLNKVRKVKPWS